ncbi:MAG: DUF4926 domain-containing protein [Candidatus Latescibacterota bacterium]
MRLSLYQEVALNRDFPEHNLRRGDLAVLVDCVDHPEGGEEGAVLEAFSARGETLCVIAVPASSVEGLRAEDVLSVRRLAEVQG